MKTKLWKTIKSRPYLITFCAAFVLFFLRFGISSIQRGKATAFVLLGIAIIAAVLSFPLVRIENLIRIRVLEYKIKKLKKVLSDNYYPEMQNKLAAVDAMDGHEFEYFCAELLKENGFVNVEVTQASGDFGVDVLAEKDGVTYAVQCKCYSDKVGNHAVQEAYAGAAYYGSSVPVVLTNQDFTPAAREMAASLGVKLWGRSELDDLLRVYESTEQRRKRMILKILKVVLKIALYAIGAAAVALLVVAGGIVVISAYAMLFAVILMFAPILVFFRPKKRRRRRR